MKSIRSILVLGVAMMLTACGDKEDKTVDRGIDSHHLSELVAGIWVDPNGCQHWIIDDGVEGYLSARMDRYGKPVCTDDYPTGYAFGDFKSGRAKNDPI